jgi:RNA-directed DNA polymerase
VGRYSKAKALQWILVHSFAAKYLAVLRVTQNKGKNTPGIDGIVWKTPAIKYAMIMSLMRKGYKSQPLRRIYIPKKNSNVGRRVIYFWARMANSPGRSRAGT